MSAVDEPSPYELVVAEDGSIPADQLVQLGLRPGAHLMVVATESVNQADRLVGSLPEFPDLAWEDFERGSAIARHDLTPACAQRWQHRPELCYK